MLSQIDLGWISGVIDLNGRVATKKNKERATKQQILYVSSKDIVIIREINRLTGTKLELQKPKPIRDFMRKSCIEHCPEAHEHVHEYDSPNLMMPPTARWTVTGASMVTVLHNVLPHLKNKKNYPELMAEVMYDTPITGRGSSMALTSLRRLYLLGWKLPTKYNGAMD